MDENIFSNPRLIHLLKQMQDVSRSRPQPYEIKGNESHMTIAQRKPLAREEQVRSKDLEEK